MLYQSLEMPREQLYTCIFARALGLDSALFRDRALTPAQRQRVAQAARLLQEQDMLREVVQSVEGIEGAKAE